jgi:hypothetical protein
MLVGLQRDNKVKAIRLARMKGWRRIHVNHGTVYTDHDVAWAKLAPTDASMRSSSA